TLVTEGALAAESLDQATVAAEVRTRGELAAKRELAAGFKELREEAQDAAAELFRRDRKSTRLNSSHVSISYAVFCLKEKSRYEARPIETSQRTIPPTDRIRSTNVGLGLLSRCWRSGYRRRSTSRPTPNAIESVTLAV